MGEDFGTLEGEVGLDESFGVLGGGGDIGLDEGIAKGLVVDVGGGEIGLEDAGEEGGLGARG